MSDTVTLIGGALGGLGLFILAIGMMTDGLKAAAGESLRHLLAVWTNTPARGIITGFTMTAIVQSSSAVTVASLGFVNAGLINLRQVLGIIFGANIGTTMTGWLVAVLGFKVNVEAVALPLIGIGMAMRLISQRGKSSAVGTVLVGFGLFFTGIDILKSSFDSLVTSFSLDQLTTQGISGIIIYLLVGILVTILTQSSSATVAITITAASSGVIGMYAAGSMIIGANIGTTSTAALAAIGATSAAKRAAAAQVIFNFVTAVVALLILPLLFVAIEWLSEAVSMPYNSAVSLALFHTLFNFLGLLLMYPFIHVLAAWLEKRFLSWEETESHPRFLDATVAITPALAVNAILNEVEALQQRLLQLYQLAAYKAMHDIHYFHRQATVAKSLCEQISTFIVSVDRAELSEEVTEQLSTLMRVNHYLYDCIHATEMLAGSLSSRERLNSEDLEQQLDEFVKHVYEGLSLLSGTTSDAAPHEQISLENLERSHEQIKTSLITAGTLHEVGISQMSSAIDCLHDAWHIARTWHKAAHRITALAAALRPDKNATEEESNTAVA
ncbi:Na/Pi cotransporter family protein [Alteromonas sp. CYL-A6]|uniref:Na/Pi cotransporter family protein n=1 Tax=Alteromonas nitratireducens TaxID=3390813 RepID=UPI0034BF469E